jgi:hypothetical protein
MSETTLLALVINDALATLPPRLVQSINQDRIDPDDRGVYYRSEGETRRLCCLGDIRALVAIALAAKELISDGRAERTDPPAVDAAQSPG